MQMNIYSIYDQAAKAYLNPFFLHNDGLAIRAFQDNVNASDDNNIAKHPDQFTLFKLASYDDQTGLIEPLPSPAHLTGGLEVKNPTPESDILKEIKALKGYLKEKPILKEIVNS